MRYSVNSRHDQENIINENNTYKVNEEGYENTPLWDEKLSLEERLDYLVKALTFEEKLQCMGTGVPDIPRLGIHAFYMGGEAAHGIQARCDQSFDIGEPQSTTIFPNPIGMSATWDTELLKKAGEVVGCEARAVYSKKGGGGLCAWAPTVDMERDPRWGRTEEAYGEDAFLAGKMAAAYIRGMRGDDPKYIRCGATLKHFYANNTEDGRVWKSSSIDPRNKYEYYLEPYRRAVVEGGAEAIMTAYNEINGVPCMLNHEIYKIAKEQWGVHHVVTDGGDVLQTVDFHDYFGTHTETVAEGLKAGIDCFTDDGSIISDSIKEAYELEMITMEEIDRAIKCHFSTMFRLGLFDRGEENPYNAIDADWLNRKESQNTSRQVSEESAVLLQNQDVDGEKLLPVSLENENKTIAVIGPHADAWFLDWYSGIPPYHITPLEGIEKIVRESGSNIDITYDSSLPQVKLQFDGEYLGFMDDEETVGIVSKEKAEVFELHLWNEEKVTLRSLSNGKLLTFLDGTDEKQRYRPGKIKAVSEQAFGWFVKEATHIEIPHMEMTGEAFYQTLLDGKAFRWRGWKNQDIFVDESGCLRVMEEDTFIEDGNQILVDMDEKDIIVAGGKKYRRVTEVKPVLCKDGIKTAQKLAEEADLVIVTDGAHPMITCKEEKDRATLNLSPWQSLLNKKIYEKNRNVILALISSVPYAIVWEKENIPAILTMAGGGMELGNALAAVIFGKSAPSGRLNMTWYCSEKDLPDMDDYDLLQHPRTYQYFEGEVLYPFGHGLTYSPMLYEKLGVEVKENSMVEVSLFVTNLGKYCSDETVQIYVTKPESEVRRPIRQLKGFQRVKEIQPGEKREVKIYIPYQEFAYYDVISRAMQVEKGMYEIQAGASSEDIRLRKMLELDGVKCGSRKAFAWNRADHYDASKNTFLWKGHMNCDSVMPICEYQEERFENPDKKDDYMEVAYEKVTFGERIPKSIILDIQMKPKATAEICLDGECIGSFEKKHAGRESRHIICKEGWASGEAKAVLRHGDGFGEIPVVLKKEKMLQLMENKQEHLLVIRSQGKVQLCRWKFC